MNMNEWVGRWWQHMPPEMQQEFSQIVQPHDVVQRDPGGKTEAGVEADIAICASAEFGSPLYRNQSGAAMMVNPDRPEEAPRHVRFGLGNTSKKVNKAWKSSDRIGITPVHITTAHVGRRLGVFTAVEVKEAGWHLTGGDSHAQAQRNFMTAVQTMGGFAGFAQSVDDYRRIISTGLQG